MIKAIGHNLVCTPIPMPEGSALTTPDGNHPHYIEVQSVGDDVKHVAPGDFVHAAGKAPGTTIDGQEYLVVTSAQVKFKVDQEDL